MSRFDFSDSEVIQEEDITDLLENDESEDHLNDKISPKTAPSVAESSVTIEEPFVESPSLSQKTVDKPTNIISLPTQTQHNLESSSLVKLIPSSKEIRIAMPTKIKSTGRVTSSITIRLKTSSKTSS